MVFLQCLGITAFTAVSRNLVRDFLYFFIEQLVVHNDKLPMCERKTKSGLGMIKIKNKYNNMERGEAHSYIR